MIRTFMEVFIGSYKDGTDGDRDYRLTAALYLFGRIMLGIFLVVLVNVVPILH